MKTLEDLEQLKESGFGQPHPRHGLKLLYWFATKCLKFNQNDVMLSCCNPETGNFGFHIFENKYERHFGKLLPNVALLYYEVGNLSKGKAYSLPHYVRNDYTHLADDSNMDRIIVSFNKNANSFDRVYVTQHRDRSNFNKNSTYDISRCLIMMIRELTLEEVLLKTGYFSILSPEELNNRHPPYLAEHRPTSSMNTNIHLVDKSPPNSMTNDSSATMSATDQNIHLKITSPILMKNHMSEQHKALATPTDQSSTDQDINLLVKSPFIISMNQTQGHHEAPPSMRSPANIHSTTHDIQPEVESFPVTMKSQTQVHHKSKPTLSTCIPVTRSSTDQNIHMEMESSPITMKSHTQGHHEVPPTLSTCIPVTRSSTDQNIHMEVESSPITMKSHTQGHHEVPPTLSTCIPVTRSSTDQNIHMEVESSPITMKSHTQGHHEVPPTLSTCIPETMSSTSQNIHLEVESFLITMKSHTQGHHEAPPTLFTCNPVTMSSTDQNIHLEVESFLIKMKSHTQGHNKAPTLSTCIPVTRSATDQNIHPEGESSPIMMKSQTQGHHKASPTPFMCSPASTSPANQDICTQTESCLSSDDIPTTSTSKPTTIYSKNTDTKSSPFSQLNSFFWGFYFLCLFSFFYFFWGNVVRIFFIVVFASSSFSQQNRKRGTRGEQTRNMATWNVAQTVVASGNKYTDTKSSPALHISSFFWGFYFISLFFFFYYFWGKVTQLFIIAVFVESVHQQNRKNYRGRDQIKANN